jgi:hypothetical protein
MTKGGRRRTGATIPGVAALAGVSRSTTSRALGGYSAVSPETLAKVRAAAEQLGYRANELARSIITGKTFTIAAVVADIEIPQGPAREAGGRRPAVGTARTPHGCSPPVPSASRATAPRSKPPPALFASDLVVAPRRAARRPRCGRDVDADWAAVRRATERRCLP